MHGNPSARGHECFEAVKLSPSEIASRMINKDVNMAKHLSLIALEDTITVVHGCKTCLYLFL